MAITAVQRLAKAAIATSVSIGAGDGWATPTAGNLLVATGNADNIVTMTTSGFTAGPSVVDNNAAYSWYKSAAGTESTVTITPAASAATALTICEYSGVVPTPIDASNSSTIAGSSGTTTNAAALSTTAAGDLVIALAALGDLRSGTPTGIGWTNSFVNQVSSGGTGLLATDVISFLAELVAGAAGSYSTAASWTNATLQRQHIILAFTASAGAAAPVGQQLLVPQAVNRSYTY
jgi:hypothetical protein